MQKPQIDGVKAKVHALSEQLTVIQAQIQSALAQYTYLEQTNNGVAPTVALPNVQDLSAQFNVYLSQALGLGQLLSSVTLVQDTEDDEVAPPEVDDRKEAWLSTAVAPQMAIDEPHEWKLGVLIRTKENPDVEAHCDEFVARLPEARTMPDSIANEKLWGFKVNQLVSRIKLGPIAGDEEYDWRAHLEAPDLGPGVATSLGDLVHVCKYGAL